MQNSECLEEGGVTDRGGGSGSVSREVLRAGDTLVIIWLWAGSLLDTRISHSATLSDGAAQAEARRTPPARQITRGAARIPASRLSDEGE